MKPITTFGTRVMSPPSLLTSTLSSRLYNDVKQRRCDSTIPVSRPGQSVRLDQSEDDGIGSRHSKLRPTAPCHVSLPSI